MNDFSVKKIPMLLVERIKRPLKIYCIVVFDLAFLLVTNIFR